MLPLQMPPAFDGNPHNVFFLCLETFAFLVCGSRFDICHVYDTVDSAHITKMKNCMKNARSCLRALHTRHLASVSQSKKVGKVMKRWQASDAAKATSTRGEPRNAHQSHDQRTYKLPFGISVLSMLSSRSQLRNLTSLSCSYLFRCSCLSPSSCCFCKSFISFCHPGGIFNILSFFPCLSWTVTFVVS